MSKYRHFSVIFSFCLLLASWCLPSQAAPLQVVSATPKGTFSSTAKRPIQITFNQPVVPLGEDAAFSSADCPITLTPAVKGSCRYAGTQTLLFEPDDKWPEATQFTVRFKPDFSSRVSGEKLSQPYQFSFSTPALQVRNIWPRDNEHWLRLSPTVFIAFNMPVRAEKLAASLSFTDQQNRSIPVKTRALTEEEWKKEFPSYEKKHILAVQPRETLSRGTRYTLRVKAGLPAVSGTLGLAKEYVSHFYTYSSLSVQGTLTDRCMPYTPAVRFSNPVRLEEFEKHITVSPSAAFEPLKESVRNDLGEEVVLTPVTNELSKQSYKKRYGVTDAELAKGVAFFFTPVNFVKLSPEKPVTVTISKKMKDIFGNELGKDYTFTMRNSGYCPAVEFNGGLRVLESYLPPYLPITLLNTFSLPLRGTVFNKDTFIPFDQKQKNYCQKTALKGTTFEGNYSFSVPRNQKKETFIDLSRFHPSARNSIVFSQVELKREYQVDGCWETSVDNITDTALTLKVSPTEVLIWAVAMKTGVPSAGLPVELRDKKNKVLWTGITDANGIARAPGWQELPLEKPDWGVPSLYAFVTSNGGDAFLNTERNGDIEPWRFNLAYLQQPRTNFIRAYLFTDRGVYQPGEEVQLNGVVRFVDKNGLSLPQERSGTLRVNNARGEKVIEQTVTVSKETGMFNFSLPIATTAPTGFWHAEFFVKGKDSMDPAYVSFQIETAKQAEFSVELTADQKAYLAGEKAHFVSSAKYQFGAALTQAPVAWKVIRNNGWFNPKDFKEYNFNPYFLREDDYKENNKTVAEGNGKTNSQGELSFSVDAPQIHFPLQLMAEADIQSPSHQHLFAKASAMVHPASFYLGVKTGDTPWVQGKPVKAEVIAVTTEEKRTQAEVTAKIRREQEIRFRRVGAFGRLEWTSDKKVTELPEQKFKVSEAGTTFSFTPEKAGNYFVTFLSSDEKGRTVKGGFSVFVPEEEGVVYRRNENKNLVLKADKASYQPGEKARIEVETPYDEAWALITVEREGILDTWTQPLKKGSSVIEVKIKENYLPNVYLGVTLVRGRLENTENKAKEDAAKPQTKTGYLTLKVTSASKKIMVNITPNQEHYAPGEKVTLQLTTRIGKKVVPADLVVMVVDEGMLALSNYQTPDLFSYFYDNKPLSVRTISNLSYVNEVQPYGETVRFSARGGVAPRMMSAKMAVNSMSDSLAVEEAAETKNAVSAVRDTFSFVPYHTSKVRTDSKGDATVSFVLPDNLTKFRIMAVAVRVQEFGNAQTDITVSKPVMVTSSLPRFARQGDRFQCNAVVYNYEDKKGKLTVRASVQGAVELQGASEQTVTVEKGTTKTVSWWCAVPRVGESTVRFTVAGANYSDGVEAKLSIRAVEKEQVLAQHAATTDEQTELLAKPHNLMVSSGNRVQVSLASTALLNVKGAMDYLIKYPYECLEQQLSRIVPVIVGEQLITDFELGDPIALKKQAQDILDRLGEYQTSSGGMGYWKNFLPDPFVTAYMLEVSMLARQQGYTLPEEVVKKAVAWLQKAFDEKQEQAYTYGRLETDTSRAYAAYVLALYGKNTEALFKDLYAKRETLPLPAVAYLLKEAYSSKRTAAVQKELGTLIYNHASYTSASVYFSLNNPLPWLHMRDVDVTALTLDALESTHQPFAHAFKTVSWLLKQLNAQGHWRSTAANAMVFRALASYYKSHESTVPNFTAEVLLQNQTVMGASFKGRETVEKNVALPFAQVYQNDSEVKTTFRKQGDGTLYYVLSQAYLPRVYDTPVDAGFTIARAISTLDDKPATHFKEGERYKVTLTITTTAPRYFVVAEDFIPAGFEIVNSSLATESQLPSVQPKRLLSYRPWRPRTFSRSETYEDRLAAFADYLPAGTHTYSYTVTAIASGKFAYPSAWVSQMYEPEVFGRNATSFVKIEK